MNRECKQVREARETGFSLVEVLVTVVVIVLLVAILVPVLSKARDRAKVAATAGTIGSIGVSLEAYKADMGGYPEPDYGNGPKFTGSDATFGFNILAQGLVGYKDFSGDGADGYGFRKKSSSSGRVYGPYLTPNGKNFKIFRQAADFPNPTAVPSSSTYKEPTQNNAGFVDAWGQPIFYWFGQSRIVGSQKQVAKNLFMDTSRPPNNFDRIFGNYNPDVHANVSYTIDGVVVNSRLVPYTPAGKWNVASTPWSAGVEMAGDGGTTAIPGAFVPGVKYRALIGATNPSNPVVIDDPIVGRNSYLLTSAGPDNLYFTGDEVINTDAR